MTELLKRCPKTSHPIAQASQPHRAACCSYWQWGHCQPGQTLLCEDFCLLCHACSPAETFPSHLPCFSPAAAGPQDCFKLLGGMLRQCERWKPSSGQLRFLVTWAFGDLEESAGRQNAFHLLKVRRAEPSWWH